MEVYDLPALAIPPGRAYHELLHVPALSVGVYLLPAGGEDRQSPHTEDEVYYVLAGQATMQVGAERRPVQAGSLIYVPAGVEHRFRDIVAALRILVFFA